MKTVGVCLITHNAKHHLPHVLPPLLNSDLNPKVLVVNSSSQDGTVELAEQMGAKTLIIPRESFNHGKTRELARKHLETDIVVMMTPDAYLVDSQMLEKLVAPLQEGVAKISYARQLPRKNAKFFEAFARHFNYPPENKLRGIEDVKTLGPHTFFCSNSCAAWSNQALDAIGGFQEVLLGEDTIACAKILYQGGKIAYVADSLVHHSHGYRLIDEFKRHFDTGLARVQIRPLLQGKDQARGKAYALSLFKRTLKQKPHLLPYAVIQTLVKWLGYQIGTRSVRAPLWFKKALSSQDFYWKN